MKGPYALIAAVLLAATGCTVNPDADKAMREERRRADSIRAAAKGVMPVAPDTGQHAMPVAPVPTTPNEMPVVNPADSSAVKPL